MTEVECFQLLPALGARPEMILIGEREARAGEFSIPSLNSKDLNKNFKTLSYNDCECAFDQIHLN